VTKIHISNYFEFAPKARAKHELLFNQGTLKGEVSLYYRPPVWLVWNQLSDNWKFSFLFAKQTGGQLYNDTSPFSVPRFNKLASGPSWWVYKVFVLRILFVPSFTSWIKKEKETFFVKSIQSFFFFILEIFVARLGWCQI
jgi:hypothetical protein